MQASGVHDNNNRRPCVIGLNHVNAKPFVREIIPGLAFENRAIIFLPKLNNKITRTFRNEQNNSACGEIWVHCQDFGWANHTTDEEAIN